jgi:hypothetical protein
MNTLRHIERRYGYRKTICFGAGAVNPSRTCGAPGRAGAPRRSTPGSRRRCPRQNQGPAPAGEVRPGDLFRVKPAGRRGGGHVCGVDLGERSGNVRACPCAGDGCHAVRHSVRSLARPVRGLALVRAERTIGPEGVPGHEARACPVDHGTGSRSQIRIDARSTVPWYMNWRCRSGSRQPHRHEDHLRQVATREPDLAPPATRPHNHQLNFLTGRPIVGKRGNPYPTRNRGRRLGSDGGSSITRRHRSACSGRYRQPSTGRLRRTDRRECARPL